MRLMKVGGKKARVLTVVAEDKQAAASSGPAVPFPNYPHGRQVGVEHLANGGGERLVPGVEASDDLVG